MWWSRYGIDCEAVSRSPRRGIPRRGERERRIVTVISDSARREARRSASSSCPLSIDCSSPAGDQLPGPTVKGTEVTGTLWRVLQSTEVQRHMHTRSRREVNREDGG